MNLELTLHVLGKDDFGSVVKQVNHHYGIF